MIGTRFYRGPINGLDSVLPGANSERALTESWRAREPLTPAKGFAGVRHHRLNVSATRCTTHKLSKKGRGRPASLHLAGSLVGLPHARLACHCEAKCCVSLPAHCKECAPCKARKHECSECCVSLPAHSKECVPPSSLSGAKLLQWLTRSAACTQWSRSWVNSWTPSKKPWTRLATHSPRCGRMASTRWMRQRTLPSLCLRPSVMTSMVGRWQAPRSRSRWSSRLPRRV